MARLTEYHNGVAVIKDKSLLSEAMEKLAQYEDMEDQLEKKEETKVGIEELDLSVRAYNILKINRVNTIEELCNKSDNALMRMRGMGLKTFEEIKAKLEEIKEVE